MRNFAPLSIVSAISRSTAARPALAKVAATAASLTPSAAERTVDVQIGGVNESESHIRLDRRRRGRREARALFVHRPASEPRCPLRNAIVEDLFKIHPNFRNRPANDDLIYL